MYAPLVDDDDYSDCLYDFQNVTLSHLMTKQDIFEDVSKPSDFIAIREKGDQDYVLMIDSYGTVFKY